MLTITGVLEDASRCYQAGNLAQADNLLRLVADRSDEYRAEALYLRGLIGIRLGLYDSACRFLDAACGKDPGNPKFQDARTYARGEISKNDARNTAVPGGAGRERFLLVKAWGYGFWSDVNQVLGALLLAEITSRKPVVWWGSNSLFSSSTGVNAFENFFLPVSDVSIDHLGEMAESFFPPKWNPGNYRQEDINKWQGQYCRMSPLYLLGRNEDLVICDFHAQVSGLADWIPPDHKLSGLGFHALYRYLADRYIRVSPHLVEAAEQFYDARLAGHKVLAVHVRSGDKALESPGLERVNAGYPELVQHYMDHFGCDRIFLLTDGQEVRDQFVERYGDKVVLTDAERSSGKVGVHYQESMDRVRLGEDVVIDVLVALKAHAFIGNGESSVSNAILHLKEWGQDRVHLINGCRWYEPNLVLYRAG